MRRNNVLLIILTLILLAICLMAGLELPIQLIFPFIMLGQIILVFTVFAILKENYHTEKTFDDFYEDFQIDNL
ncbi:hypothetical protein [Aegicerativicinus sediminis]